MDYQAQLAKVPPTSLKLIYRLLNNLKNVGVSIGGSVVEFSPATREAWVRFPANPGTLLLGIHGGSDGEELPAKWESWIRIPGLGRSPEGRQRQPTPVILPEESPRTKEPVRLQSTESQRAGHD